MVASNRNNSNKRTLSEREAGEVSPSASASSVLFGDEAERREEELIEERRRKRAAIVERHRSMKQQQQHQEVVTQTTRSAPEPTPPRQNHQHHQRRQQQQQQQRRREDDEERRPSPIETESRVTDNPVRPSRSSDDAAAAAAAGRGDDADADADKDLFASGDDDDDDMFAENSEMDGAVVPRDPSSAVAAAEPSKQIGLAGPARAEPEAIRGKGLADDWDDEEGYYNFRVGEVRSLPHPAPAPRLPPDLTPLCPHRLFPPLTLQVLCEKYEVYSNCGQGVFSTVLRARPIGGAGKGQEVAVKVVRANDVMRKAAEQEVSILRKLASADPEGKSHCIRLLETFEYRNHVCMVFEALDMNLREVVKKFGRDVGINLKAVRTYSYQLLRALKLLRTCQILHADIKPDNILLNASHTETKLCDLGSAVRAGDNHELTPYLVSRFYRAPEVILGLPYGYAMDMWSLGCVIYELFTGKFAFAGNSNNHMLKLMMDAKGAFPKKMLKKGTFVERHFDPQDVNMTFYLVETDPVTKNPVRSEVKHPKATRSVYKELEAKAGKATDRKKLHQFADLLEQIFMLDPDRRITVSDALAHPFITEKM